MKKLLSGNEAVARGAYEYGVVVATAYPGTPSTEILEEISKNYPEIYAEWSTNEKVAFEVALGAAFAGARSLVAMKHVGLNVAADPLMTSAQIGVVGGFVIVSADDPGMHSSQNEQDNRRYALFAKIPLIEPSDSQESKDFLGAALEISERFSIPVLFRITTRISHSKGIVELGERKESVIKPYQKNIAQRVTVPSNARKLHIALEKKLERIREYAETCHLNRIEWGDKKIGIITSGISYQYAREVFPGASFLKLGLSYPFPGKLVKGFADRVERLIVIEENEPFIEEQCRLLGLAPEGKDKLSLCGELNQAIIREAFGLTSSKPGIDVSDIPARFPVLCPGCPHRGFFYLLHKHKVTATGDIGCYTLGIVPPLEALETCVCMGASVGNARGMELAFDRSGDKRRVVAVIGDSTFIHGGITGLIDIAYNKGKTIVVVLDNNTTAMTGFQPHPGTGCTIRGEATVRLEFSKLAEAMGIKRYYETPAYDLKAIDRVLKEALSSDEPALIVNKGPCILLRRGEKFVPNKVDPEKCTACGMCFRLGCPAIYRLEDKKAYIDPLFCVGEVCNLCVQLCPFEAIGADKEVA